MEEPMSDKSSKIRAGRDYVGGDQNINASHGGVVINGDASGNVISTGSTSTTTNITNLFEVIYRKVDESALPPQTKDDVKAEVAEVEKEVKKGDQVDESFLRRRLNSIQTMAPDILDVVVAAIANPVAGISMVAKKVAEKIRADRAASASKS
jgi:hypothetical protein